MREQQAPLFRTERGELVLHPLIRHGLRRATFPKGEGLGVSAPQY